MPNLGYSFSPTAAQADEAKRGATSPPFGSQGAIKTLSYQMPKFTGAASSAAISPLVGQESRGGFSNAVIESVLRTVLGPDHASQILAGGGGGGVTPNSIADSGRAANGPQDYAAGDRGFAAALAQLSGGGRSSTPAPSVTPGGVPETGPPPDVGGPAADAVGTREDALPPPPDIDRSGAQTPPSAPDFGGGGDTWHTMKRDRYAGNGF